MSNINLFSVRLKGRELIVADRPKGSLVIYPPGHTAPAIKVHSVFDIIALRDLLNDAFPPEVYKHDPVRVPKKSS